MAKLLRADFFRLWRSKCFWACMVFQVGSGLFFPTTAYVQYTQTGYAIAPDWNLFSGVVFVCVLAALFCSLFVGTEYSDGTVRNKLVVGHRRWEIYLCHLITCTVASLWMCVGYLVPYLAVSLPLMGGFEADIYTLLWFVLVSVLLTVALTSIYTMISMLNQNKAIVTAVCIVSSFLLLMVGSYLQSRLAQPETYEWTRYDPETGKVVEETVENQDYLEGLPREICQLVYDVLPTGQVMQCNAWDAPNLPRLPVYSVAVTVVTTGVGMALFRRKDLK